MLRKIIASLLLVTPLVGCPPGPTPTPASPDTVTAAGSTTTPPNRVINGPLPGCADAFELVAQTVTLPATEITFDVGGIIDRVGIVVPGGATYAFSTRPVNPLDCTSTTLPAVPMPTVTFGFNYLGDFSRVNPVCMNASNTVLTSFSITGTPADALVEGVVLDLIWREVDLNAATRLEALLNGGTFPATANPRCGNWVDLATLPPPPSP